MHTQNQNAFLLFHTRTKTATPFFRELHPEWFMHFLQAETMQTHKRDWHRPRKSSIQTCRPPTSIYTLDSSEIHSYVALCSCNISFNPHNLTVRLPHLNHTGLDVSAKEMPAASKINHRLLHYLFHSTPSRSTCTPHSVWSQFCHVLPGTALPLFFSKQRKAIGNPYAGGMRCTLHLRVWSSPSLSPRGGRGRLLLLASVGVLAGGRGNPRARLDSGLPCTLARTVLLEVARVLAPPAPLWSPRLLLLLLLLRGRLLGGTLTVLSVPLISKPTRSPTPSLLASEGSLSAPTLPLSRLDLCISIKGRKPLELLLQSDIVNLSEIQLPPQSRKFRSEGVDKLHTLVVREGIDDHDDFGGICDLSLRVVGIEEEILESLVDLCER
uniref:Uncharacterized protein n=1 Tax=Chromera velia CCMP2878 TaxID=1169474 RepID=A0A0G4I197_9ALVE|eukprot:Cvel_22.t1-p1 / transcript=Cvel_22.t1 / gene=Cvel_22 / organism=Chromera_velia_CCMP2878 / gene_product=hypothetical protein / transcript_product=hypothetical protein / location=Cvel_scaffold5:147241-148383(-) / protein_length=381 / sequence_SO=supercontig / SO=protein_coding / is_pseudo=false